MRLPVRQRRRSRQGYNAGSVLQQNGDHRSGLHLRVPAGLQGRRVWLAVRALRRRAAVLMRRGELLEKFKLRTVSDVPTASVDRGGVRRLRINGGRHGLRLPAAALPLAAAQPLRAVQRMRP